MNIETDITGRSNMATGFHFLTQILGVADISVFPAKKLIGVFAIYLPYISAGYFDVVASWFQWTLPGVVVRKK